MFHSHSVFFFSLPCLHLSLRFSLNSTWIRLWKPSSCQQIWNDHPHEPLASKFYFPSFNLHPPDCVLVSFLHVHSSQEAPSLSQHPSPFPMQMSIIWNGFLAFQCFCFSSFFLHLHKCILVASLHNILLRKRHISATSPTLFRIPFM